MSTRRDREERNDRQKHVYASAKKKAENASSGGESTSLKIPQGASWLSLKKPGKYRLDIVPYKVGKGNPNADKGMLHYERTYWVHFNVGIESKKGFVCPYKTSGKRCPVCEKRAEAERNGDKEIAEAWKPKERQLFNAINVDEPAKGVQIIEYSYYLFGKFIDNKVNAADPDDNYEDFYHLQGGSTLKVTMVEEKTGGFTCTKVQDLEMKARKDYDEDILEQTHCLDDMLVELDYADLKKVLDGGLPQEDEEEDKKPARKSRDDDEDEDKPVSKKSSKDDDDEEEDRPKKKSSRDDDEDEEKPTRKSSRDDDDDEEPEDDELPRRRVRR